MKAYGGVEIYLHALTSALDGSEWSDSRPCRFTPKERTRGTIGYEAGWVTELDMTRWWKEKFPAPAETRTSDHPARSPAQCRWAMPAPYNHELTPKCNK
jgi:hypothetical protein